MFTTEPSLTQRIGRMIGDTTIIDPQTQIRCDRPGALDLAALMGDPHVLADLASVGMPPTDLDAGLPADERVLRSLPYLKRARNTSASWCLYRIFRDLYDFDEPHLDPTNYRSLFEKVASSAQEPDWARAILVDRARITTFVTGIEDRAEGSSVLSERALYRVDAPWASFVGLGKLAEILGELPATGARLERLIFDWLDRSLAGDARFVTLPCPVGPTLASLDGASLDSSWARFSTGRPTSIAEQEALAMGVARSIFRWHEEHRRTLRLVAPVARANSSRDRLLENLNEILAAFPHARFDLMLGPAVGHRDQDAMASRWPHVSVSGIGWKDASARSIAETLGHRVQAVAAVKVVGFSSDASSVEWAYGRLQLAKKAMGSALGRLIEDGFFEEDELLPLIRQILHDSPRDRLGLETPR